MGESYFSTKMDASGQGSAIPPCQFSHHVLYLLPQMSSNIKNEDLLSKQLNLNLIDIYPIQKNMYSDIPCQ